MADDMIMFRSCLASQVNSRAIIPGSLLVCTDSGDIYHDTSDSERIRISRDVCFLATDTERTTMLAPESDKLYVVLATFKMYIYNSGWVCLNPDPTITYYIHNVESTIGSSSVQDARVTSDSTAKFIIDPSMYDLYSNNVTCTCSDGTVTMNNNSTRVLYGTIEVTS